MRPTRLLKRDVGSNMRCLEGSPDTNAILSTLVMRNSEADTAATSWAAPVHPFLISDHDKDPDEDPLELGCVFG